MPFLPDSNLIGKIPVQNIWLLMAYAAEFSHLDKKTKSSFIRNSDDLPDLVTTLLCNALAKRLHSGLTTGYINREESLTRVRGRINHLKTESKMLLRRGRISCTYTELSNNTPRNQFIKSSLLSISSKVKDKQLSRQALSLARTFDELGVESKLPTYTELSKDRFGRHDYHDKEIVELAKMAMELNIPSENVGDTSHYQPDKNEYWVRRLFEKAIAGFFRIKHSPAEIKVRTGTPLYWPSSRETPGLSQILPSMKADIIIDDVHSHKRLVIDTKFNQITVAGWMREETLRSGYLYQIYSYLRTQETSGDPLDAYSSGLLLHPAVGEGVFESTVIQNHKISFATIDLTLSSEKIKSELSTLLSLSI